MKDFFHLKSVGVGTLKIISNIIAKDDFCHDTVIALPAFKQRRVCAGGRALDNESVKNTIYTLRANAGHRAKPSFSIDNK